MATADELRQFLLKRGYLVDIDKRENNTYIISIRSKKVEDVTNLLASINEPGRFVVAVKLEDIIPIIGEILGVDKLRKDILTLEADMHRNSDRLSNTDDENKRQAEESLSAHTRKIDSLKEMLESLEHKIDSQKHDTDSLIEDMTYIKRQPWWKRFLGVK